jgi:Ca2+-transporting ATPase
MANYFDQEPGDVIKQLETDRSNGLTHDEVARRLEKYGQNQLDSKGKKSFLSVFFAQFKSFMIIILLIAAVISGIVGVTEGEGLLDTYVILGILIVNALVGAYQEKKAESSLEALKSLSAPETKVLRSGNIEKVPSEELVPGDIVILETGDIVPADLRLIEAWNLKIMESSLTGESLPSDKQTAILKGADIALGDRTNMAYSSGIVSYGRGRGVVATTGMKTEVGRIAGMLQETVDTETPMTRRLEGLGKILGIAALVICAVIFAVGLLYGHSIMAMFMTAVSLAVAAIPEGLPAVSTVVLAIGVQRMVKKNAIIRTLPSVETLGSASVICSDKTGTLTQNKMTVVETFVNREKKRINRNEPVAELSIEETRLLMISVLCCDVQVLKKENGEKELAGDPTETALTDLGLHYGIDKAESEKRNPRIAEIPFDSERKRMTTINRMENGKIRISVKGGLDEVLSACNRIDFNGEVRPLGDDSLSAIRKINEEMANSALRVLAMAYREADEEPREVKVETIEKDLVFTGILGMIDPSRPEVIDAVAKCNEAGIRPVMITGDHRNTAIAIAREIGIFRDGDTAITGSDLEKMNDDQLNENVTRYSVYARVAPEHKVRIVKAWQKHGEVVAMTGDGVNDAPALKQADIGAAMGITGTDVAKGAADMVLTDDNFATIVSAVEEGRRIYDNILKAIQFLLSTNVGEIFLLLVTSIFNLGTPLLPIHILWVNLVTDSLPALALSIDPPEEGLMKRMPRSSKGGFMTKGMIWRVLYQGVMIGSLPLIAYITGLKDGGQVLGQTMAFSVLVFAQLLHVRNLHSITRSSLTISPLKNLPLLGAIFVSSLLGLAVLLVPPLREAFKFTVMDGRHWLIVAVLSLLPIVIVDIFKLLKINGTRDEN